MHLTCTWCPFFGCDGDIFPKQPLPLFMLSLGCVPVACGLDFYAERSTSLRTHENRAALFTWTSASIAFHLNYADHILPEGEDRSAARVWLIAADDFFLNSGEPEGSLASCLSLRVQKGKQEHSWRGRRHLFVCLFVYLFILGRKLNRQNCLLKEVLRKREEKEEKEKKKSN